MGSPVQSNFYQAGCRNSSAGEKSLRRVTSFKAHSCLITMALDHFLTFCWPVERSAGPTLSHAHNSSILLLLLSNPWLPLQQPQSHRMNGAAWGMWTQREECHFAECYPPKPVDVCTQTHTHTHRSTPQAQACLNAGGKKSYYDFFFNERICAQDRVQHLIEF